MALAIPPGVERFVIDSYCPAGASLVRIIYSEFFSEISFLKFFLYEKRGTNS
jgi:hypothetical protein